jgi:hypothetical protein
MLELLRCSALSLALRIPNEWDDFERKMMRQLDGRG